MMKQDREFRKRFDARKQELEALFQSLYGPKRQYLDQLEDRLVSFWEKRPDGLKLLDERRGMDPDWYMARSAVGLTMYTDLFAGNLKGLEQKVPYLKELGVTYLHLMPVLKMPQGENDGGYAVDDFNTIDPKFGTNDDFIHLTETLHAHGISLCLDFVMNHTSSTHTWAMLAKQGNKEFQERYQCYDDRTYPDQYEKTVPQVFPTTAPGNFIWCEEMHKWVLSSFYPFQWDLDYHNPVVLNEMVSSMLHLANMGVDVFRLDAVPYIWKELGTTCRNLPQVHTIVRLFRIACEIVCPAVALKGEVVMAPRELAAYFGSPSHPECHFLYGVSLMVNLWSSLASQDARLLMRQTEALLSLPPHCRFLNYIRCHDDIGWGLDEEQERTLGIDPLLHKMFLYHFYEGDFPGSYARGELYNFDPVSMDARSCGTAASLVGFEAAKTEEESNQAYDRLRLLYGTVFALRGFPMISSGDEIGQLNDYSYKQDPLRKDDSRNVHRSPFNWRLAGLRHDRNTMQGKIWTMFQELRTTRAARDVFDPDAEVSTWDPQNPRVFALRRKKGNHIMLCVSNFSDHPEAVRFAYFTGTYVDAFTGKEVVPGWGFEMLPHALLWLENRETL